MAGVLLDTVDSTNSAAMRLARVGRLCDGDYVLAREQSAGRGTHGRAWSSPRDAGIYLSVVRMATCNVLPLTSDYTLAAGLAAAEVLRERTGLDVRLKPVNDLYVHGRKLGGILVEGAAEQARLVVLVIGVGINVHRAALDLPHDAPPATSLAAELPGCVVADLAPEVLALPLVTRIVHWTDCVRSGGMAEVHRRCAWLRGGSEAAAQ